LPKSSILSGERRKKRGGEEGEGGNSANKENRRFGTRKTGISIFLFVLFPTGKKERKGGKGKIRKNSKSDLSEDRRSPYPYSTSRRKKKKEKGEEEIEKEFK